MEEKRKIIDIPLSFLTGGSYTLNAYEDDPERGDGIIKKVSKVSKSDHIKLSVRPAGGFVAKLTKLNSGDSGLKLKAIASKFYFLTLVPYYLTP